MFDNSIKGEDLGNIFYFAFVSGFDKICGYACVSIISSTKSIFLEKLLTVNNRLSDTKTTNVIMDKIGTKLINKIKNDYKTKCKMLFTSPKETAIGFYKKLGFKSIPDDEYDMHYLEIDGKKKSKRKSKKKKSKRKWSKQK